ncbi:ABC transporter ATP-binding protein [Arachnia propionica]|uniref:ATP-binding cassette domain-containing protein n=1 Tax=Arachnia propionica TaxID=1750 RepID=A0A3P1WRZ4_9ACTN|nr:ATP-binding cassette domain-containing protein [Arachnia propionica]RRD47223.1 ATP-binding cassette domain-containing protein [Arachnia propionica]
MTVVVNRLTKTFKSTRALNCLTFSLREGEIFGFVGSNGAGKTTTMRIILGVLAPDSGTVTWNGKFIGIQERRKIGYMPEERGLYPRMKVGEQLIYLARLHTFSTKEAKHTVNKWLDRLGLTPRTNDELQALSLGNQQRVQLAAALIHQPALLILDEPFSGLDPIAVDAMVEVLREYTDTGHSVMFSSHQLELVERVSDSVGILSQGTLVAAGAINELRSSAKSRYAITADPGVISKADQWVSQLQGTSLIYRDNTQAVIEFSKANFDEQDLLHTALRTGPVREFRPVIPSLADIYREHVSSDLDNENRRAREEP